MRRGLRLVALVVTLVGGGGGGGGGGARAEPLPYRLWWSFPGDDESAIEVDEADMHQSAFQTRWPFVLLLRRCDPKRTRALLKRKDGTPIREIRVELLGGDGEVRQVERCTLSLEEWRARAGARLVERLDDELDAHVAFLLPRKRPGLPSPTRPPSGEGKGRP